MKKEIIYKKGTNGLDIKFIKKEIREVIRDSWVDFGNEYIENHVMTSDFIFFAFYDKKLVGITAAKKVKYEKRVIYNIEFTSVRKSHQGFKISKNLNKLMFLEILKDSLKRFDLCFEVMTITSSPRVLGLMARTASSIYPDPYNDDVGYDELLDKRIKRLIYDKRIVPEDYNIRLDHYLMEGFYDNRSEFMYKEEDFPWDRDSIVNKFSDSKLDYKNKKGREFVVLAKYCVFDILKKVK